MSKTITLRVKEETYELYKKLAKEDNRSMSNFIETAVNKYIEDDIYIDEKEMKEILNDKELMKSIERGIEDVKKGRVKLVG